MTAQAPFILALDQGTTSSRALLVDAAGTIAGLAAVPFRQHYPRPGWVEHDPETIWSSQQQAMEQVLRGARLAPGDLAAVGITNQRETTLLWERSTGRPLHPAIVWQDRRTAGRCAELVDAGHTRLLRQVTGLVPDPYFSATKLEWLLTEIPGARDAAERGDLAFGTVDTWLIWKLTGGEAHRTDTTNASRTLLWNLEERRWDDRLLELFGVPRAVLPDALPSSGGFGETRIDGRAVPIAGVAGDQQAALFGQAGWRPGLAKNTYGTGCFLLLNTGDEAPRSRHGLLTTAACGPGGAPGHALEGSVFVAGAAVQWLRDGLGLIQEAAETEPLARSVPDSGGVYLVPAFTGLGAPHWDPNARGLVIGLTRGTTRAHLARATLEAIALQTLEVVQAMTADAGEPLRALRVDGGAAENGFLMQLQADLLGLPVERAAERETTALGAAYLAGLGCGLWSQADLERMWRSDRVFEPAMSEDQRQSLLHGWRRAVERAREWEA